MIVTKNEIATRSAVTQLTEKVAATKVLLTECMTLLKEDKHIDASQAWLSTHDVKTAEVDLINSPLETMKLRMFIVNRLCSDTCKDPTHLVETLKYIDADTYLGGEPELRKTSWVEHFNVIIDTRNDWGKNIKTDQALDIYAKNTGQL